MISFFNGNSIDSVLKVLDFQTRPSLAHGFQFHYGLWRPYEILIHVQWKFTQNMSQNHCNVYLLHDFFLKKRKKIKPFLNSPNVAHHFLAWKNMTWTEFNMCNADMTTRSFRIIQMKFLVGNVKVDDAKQMRDLLGNALSVLPKSSWEILLI